VTLAPGAPRYWLALPTSKAVELTERDSGLQPVRLDVAAAAVEKDNGPAEQPNAQTR